ncbi:putative FAD dependent oxidoreductase [Xylariomycetidae sp. FL0641]|nr:putative FAD dependent oxidoreductase [Xylariomycetidae sp. FL0641]
MATTSPPKDITIVGGGIIGCSTAYFLTRHPAYSPSTHRITLLEAASTSSGGRTADSLSDPATLADPASAAAPRNPAHDGIAGGASGKAGGLLALWAFPSNIVPLSFRLHDELAREHDGARRWGYRRCYASQVECRARLPAAGFGSKGDEAAAGPVSGGGEEEEGASKGLHKDHKIDPAALRRLGAPADLDWLDAERALRAYDGMGTPDNTAQVHPELFTRSMAQLAEEAGVRIVTGARVTAIDKAAGGKAVAGVTYEKDGSAHSQAAGAVVVAAGPWTRRLLPEVPVTASRAHSIVVRTPRPLSPYALFTAIALPAGFPSPAGPGARGSPAAAPLKRPQVVEPEIYARPDGTAYACGPTDAAVPLPPTTAEVEVDEARCADLARQVGAVSDELGRDGAVLARQACYLPQGGPYIGEVGGGVAGLVVAAGHTCWGIQNAPATGKLVSEIVLDGAAKSAKLGGCDPARALP